MSTQRNKSSTVQKLELAGWVAVTAYCLLTILYLVPFYNPWFRVPVNLLSIVMFFISLATIAFVLVPLYLYKKRFYRCVACIALGFIIIIAAKHTYDWRVQLTEKLIQTHYCRENKIYQKGTVLGGITNAGGVFANKYHCPTEICKEFYYCDREAEPQSQQRQWLIIPCLAYR